MPKPHGYVVMESCEEYEQVLALQRGEGLPAKGVLVWASKEAQRTVFATRKLAREAISRTHHFGEAFGETGNSVPETQFCKVEPVSFEAIGEA